MWNKFHLLLLLNVKSMFFEDFYWLRQVFFLFERCMTHLYVLISYMTRVIPLSKPSKSKCIYLINYKYKRWRFLGMVGGGTHILLPRLHPTLPYLTLPLHLTRLLCFKNYEWLIVSSAPDVKVSGANHIKWVLFTRNKFFHIPPIKVRVFNEKFCAF